MLFGKKLVRTTNFDSETKPQHLSTVIKSVTPPGKGFWGFTKDWCQWHTVRGTK